MNFALNFGLSPKELGSNLAIEIGRKSVKVVLTFIDNKAIF